MLHKLDIFILKSDGDLGHNKSRLNYAQYAISELEPCVNIHHDDSNWNNQQREEIMFSSCIFILLLKVLVSMVHFITVHLFKSISH